MDNISTAYQFDTDTQVWLARATSVTQAPEKHPSMFPNQIRRRAKALAIPLSIRAEFVETFLMWTEKSGEEWTVQRLKAFTTYLTAKFAGQNLQLPAWIAKSRKGNTKGILGALERYALESPRNFKKAQKLLRITTALVATNVTPNQDRKFFESAMRPLKAVPPKYHLMMIKAVKQLKAEGLIRSSVLPKPQHILVSQRRPDHVEDMWLQELSYFWRHEHARYEWFPKYETVIRASLGDLPTTGFTRFSYGEGLVVGKIKLSQEPGYKGRIYASPQNHLQHVLEPLKQGLGTIVKGLPWDCTFDQKKGHKYIEQALSEGTVVHCFDLSDATNNFPMELQETALCEAFPKGNSRLLVEFFSDVSKAEWQVDIPGSQYDNQTITFTRGQPLGLGPSFFSFDLCHGLLLYALNGYKWDGEFFILGDDVVILCPELAKRYAQALEDLDLPWSKDKTLISDRMAEFAGYLFFSDSSALLKPKWKRLTKDNVLTSLELWGAGLLDEVSCEIRDFLRWFVQQPFGFDWTLTPDKAPAETLWDGYLDLFFGTEEQDPTPVEYSPIQLVNERIYKNDLYGYHSVWKDTNYSIPIDQVLLSEIHNTMSRAAHEIAELPPRIQQMCEMGLPTGDLHRRFIPESRLPSASPLLSRAQKERALRNKRFKLIRPEVNDPVAALMTKILGHNTTDSVRIAETLRNLETGAQSNEQ